MSKDHNTGRKRLASSDKASGTIIPIELHIDPSPAGLEVHSRKWLSPNAGHKRHGQRQHRLMSMKYWPLITKEATPTPSLVLRCPQTAVNYGILKGDYSVQDSKRRGFGLVSSINFLTVVQPRRVERLFTLKFFQRNLKLSNGINLSRQDRHRARRTGRRASARHATWPGHVTNSNSASRLGEAEYILFLNTLSSYLPIITLDIVSVVKRSPKGGFRPRFAFGNEELEAEARGMAS
ncbi:hypothetical protein EVAR_95594_1 [Eumeta japonica]|uniref:Uncharacterized protein n=1 Tax=Eumeta variegata TaxID=151549 RepID=A0A4C1VMI2_EUMVA|nr:hypothetical protein EVAR_95594_1 [Eumeta japonica]